MLAYYDSAAGVLACKILEARPGAIGQFEFKIRITARNSRFYPCGEILETNGLAVFPRRALYRKKYGWRILAYDWNMWAGDLPLCAGESSQ